MSLFRSKKTIHDPNTIRLNDEWDCNRVFKEKAKSFKKIGQGTKGILVSHSSGYALKGYKDVKDCNKAKEEYEFQKKIGLFYTNPIR